MHFTENYILEFLEKLDYMRNFDSHDLRRSDGKGLTCAFCFNTWAALYDAISSYQSCARCGLNIHSNCKHLIDYCQSCSRKPFQYEPKFPSVGGNLEIRLKHCYDVELASGIYLYGKLSISDISIRSKQQYSDGKEIAWTDSKSLTIPTISSVQNRLRFEIWSCGYFEIFDQLVYYSEVDLSPVLLHPNCLIERWFNLHQMGSDTSQEGSGKVLIEFLYTFHNEEAVTEEKDTAIQNLLNGEVIEVSDNSKSEVPEEEQIEQKDDAIRIQQMVEQLAVSDKISPDDGSKSSTIGSLLVDSVSSLGNLLYELETKSLEAVDAGSNNRKTENDPTLSLPEPSTVGTLALEIKSACRYDVADAAEGDHYVTIEMENESKLTSHVVRNSATPIFNISLVLPVPHFRAVIDIILWDAQSGNKVGSSRLTAYQIMQKKADTYFLKSLGYNDNTLAIFDMTGKEELGYFAGSFDFQEDLQRHYYSSAVRYSLNSPEEELSVERLGVHIARFTDLYNLFSQVYSEYLYIMNWTDPILTLFLFLVFLYCTIEVNPDYSFSCVIFGIIILMTRTLLRRKNGDYLRVYLSKGVKEIIPEYRPLAEVKTGVLAYKLHDTHTSSSNKGVNPSSTFGFLVPSTTTAEVSSHHPPVLKATLSLMAESDNGGAKEHLIGYLGTSDITADSEGVSGVTQFVNNFLGSETEKKYWHITNVMDVWDRPVERQLLDQVGGMKGCIPATAADCCLLYKIPQPILSKLSESEIVLQEKREAEGNPNSPFLPWSQNHSLLNFHLYQDSGSGSLVRDKRGGCIKVPIKDIITHGRLISVDSHKRTTMELVQWFAIQTHERKLPDKSRAPPHFADVTTTSTTTSRSLSEDDRKYASASEKSALVPDGMEVLLRLQITLPSEKESHSPSDIEKSQSQTLQTILSGRVDKESTTFTVLWNMRDHVKYVQNLMNWILDLLESFKNIFNWTIPSKTLVVYLSLFVLWILTILIPGRILILIIGLYEFLYIFLPIPDGNEISIRFFNFLNSIPNDDDLVQIYAKERQQYHAKKNERKQRQINEILLNVSLPCLWSGMVYIKWNAGDRISVESAEWTESYLLLQGKRILWWKTVEDSNRNEIPSKPPKGQILLTPHSGITQVSPVDVRLLLEAAPEVTIDHFLSIFGLDPTGKPVKLSICFHTNHSKGEVESIIRGIIGK